MSGCVYLVGAGPGDPRLLTVRAHELVRVADVLAFDELVSPEILALAPRDAERIPVGRRAGHGPTTFRLHPAVLARARGGRDVVRLKCGDPMVFGRGGEEAEELAAHGVPFELVPGISAALGASAYAGIPLTHRECASSVRLSTGHYTDDARAETGGRSTERLGDKEIAGHADGRGSATISRSADRPHGETSAPHTDDPGRGTINRSAGRARGETLVIYMAARRVAQSLAELARSGWPTSTPVAWIAAATTPSQQVIVGTIGSLQVPVASAPALLIVGEVVARRTPWWEARPLATRRVLVARARPGRSKIAARLRALGAEVIEAPTIDITPLPELEALDAISDQAAVGFGCATGVDVVLQRRSIAPRRIVAFGLDAAAALERHGIEPGLVVGGACREALEPVAGRLARRPLVAITATGGRPALVDELTSLGVRCYTIAAYRAVPRLPPLPPVDIVAAPSSSAARLVLADASLHERPFVAMGERTAAAARACGAMRVELAASDTIDALVQRVVEVAQC